ncbi:MAG: hypothetical protein M3Y39_06195 [Chloroflexota bacterium]|nr:hypothetical protein [Chloroflexota bacterium]
MASLWPEVDTLMLYTIALKFEHLSLQSWGISSRTLNALLRYNFKMTVGDVIRAEDDFVTIRGLGTAGIEELKTKILQLLAIECDADTTNLPVNQLPALNDLKFSEWPVKASPKVLFETTQVLPLSYLHLDNKTYEALMDAGINTIGQLYNVNNTFVGNIKGFHANSLGNLNNALVMLLNSLNNENEVNWFHYWENQKIQIFPLTTPANASSEQILEQLPSVIEEVLCQELDEKASMIIKRRFGLSNVERLTLEDIGDAYGLSKERVRQIEEKSLKILRSVFGGKRYTRKRYQVHPEIYRMIELICSIVEAEESKVILETKLLEYVYSSFNIDIKRVKSSLFLILTLIGMERIEFDYPDAIPVWGCIDLAKRTLLEIGIKRLDSHLTRETSLPYTEFDILTQINKGAKKTEKVTLAQLPWLIDLCISVERREDGSVWGKFEYLKGWGNRVERLLIETGIPMSLADMVREINYRLVPLGRHQITDNYLGNDLGGDDRFVPIGRSGSWSLKSWDHVDTKSILELMEQYLITQNKPVTADDIYIYVSERRQVSKNSIIAYLATEKTRFIKLSLTTWGLAKWSDKTTSNGWNVIQVATFVASIFRTHKVKELEYKVIKEALMKETGVSASTAQGMLNVNPVIKTRRGKKWGELIAVLQPDYKEILAQAQTSHRRRRGNPRSKIEVSAYEILNVRPDRQMPMDELIRELQKQFDYAEVTLYQYIGQMKSIERIDVPNSRKKICRAKKINGPITSGNLQERISRSVRAILEAMPGKQMSLADLIIRLRREYNCPKATLYQYIARLDYIERVNVSGSKTKMCRIKDAQGTQLFQQTQNITNVILREDVQKALSNLTEENVDVGLFQLGRQFESTLKTFLVAAYAKQKLAKTPGNISPDQLKLFEMIKCLKDNGFVTDDAALSYLRQQRNDRAHGSTPNLAERRVLMNNVHYLASLYIDYIKLLDDLFQNLYK